MIAMRFRESDYAAIKRKAEKANMNFTEFVTAAAMNKPVTVINGLENVLKEQKAIGRNINQLTTLCNMGKIVCPDLRELKEQYTEVLTTLNEIVGRCG
ncbi:plasmid mobilization relaxosome protein MobC [Phocea massiliensis]|uniref:Plasmid mobilization relaxosome protein MobC n=1 Tax=Merdimmobilis hominis TaxID=2897707 RepID=A0A938X4Q0_9FIRM|nr:MobC family plasmid mobilization relaxosome protein [Merdimmobilis hominis]MBM6920161.1 plasmid mobilization relaxosome protein MobC [Merdimmobilis hominis]